MNISPARTAAFDILLRIERESAYSSALLPLYESNLDGADRGLCHQIVLGTLRKKLLLDHIINQIAGSKKLDVEVRLALWIGLYQLLFLDRIPDHSAINESVELVARAKKRSAKGFVNAILRKATKGIPDLIFSDEVERLSVETSHPRWLIERWIRRFGESQTTEIAAANNAAPDLTFRIVSDEVRPNDAWRSSALTEGAFSAERIDASLRDLDANGKIYFQDAASQLVASSISVPDRGRFLDVSAAPGGKTGLVSRRNPGSLVVAGDIHASRILLLENNLERQDALSVSVLQYDAELGLPFADRSFDTVLVDAPCSGTGTIRHNPEIRYSVKHDDLAELSSKQHRILANASNLVRSGGSLVYSTCSMEREEGEDVATRFAGENPEFEGIAPNVPERLITNEGFARTWPHRDGVDGFFIASFRRRLGSCKPDKSVKLSTWFLE